MKICPTCGNSYPDEANFCPMDAAKLPPPAVSPTPAAAPVATVAVAEGAKLIAGRFALGRELPATVTGTVYESQDVTSGQLVQVKLVAQRALPTAMVADRALRELKQLAKVKSERVGRVLDQGRSEDGRVYVASELHRGATLAQLVERDGALGFDQARAILLAVGEALIEAQKVGVIHRDVAPRNVIVDGNQVKLIDFGLAEPVTDRVFGSPAFLSPEQAEGKPVDQRSNIYSLGALFYYMLTGGPPFLGDRDAQLQQHLNAEPQPASARRQGVLPEVDRLILKAMEKAGGRRHLTLRQLLNDVGGLPGAQLGALRGASASGRDLSAASTEISPRPVVELDGPTQAMEVAAPPDGDASAHTRATDPGTIRMPSTPAAAPARPVAVPVLETIPASPAPVAKSAISSAVAAVAEGATPAISGQVTAPLAAKREVALAPAPSAQLAAPAPIALATSPVARPVKPAAAAPAPIVIQPVPTAPKVSAPGPSRPAAVSPMAARQATPTPAGKAGRKGFRETAWFKKGELEEEMQKAAAANANPDDPLAGPLMEKEAVVDDNALTATDRARLSLKTGNTETMPVVKPGLILPGERMSEEEMLAEVDSSKKKMVIAGVLIGALMLVVTIAYFLFSGGGK